MRLLALALMIVSTTFIGACSSVPEEVNVDIDKSNHTPAYRTLSIDDLAEIMMGEEKTYTVVNVHIPYQGEIQGTNLNVAYDDLESLTTALPDKNAPIILYCRSGNMSEQATRELVELGYTQVYDVPGGMNAWQASGRTLVNNE